LNGAAETSCRLIVALCVFASAIALPVDSPLAAQERRAEVWDVKAMLELYQMLPIADRAKIEYDLFKIESGLGWANAELTMVRKTSPLYCAPTKISLTGSQLADILRRASEDDPAGIGKMPVGLGLLRSLERAFPCPQQSK
jgi:hypothetical protein